MALMNDYINNGKLKVTGTTDCASCKVDNKPLEVNNTTIASNTSSTKLVSAAQVVAYITGLRN